MTNYKFIVIDQDEEVEPVRDEQIDEPVDRAHDERCRTSDQQHLASHHRLRDLQASLAHHALHWRRRHHADHRQAAQPLLDRPEETTAPRQQEDEAGGGD